MDTRGIAEGMQVRGEDGEKLGKVIECASDGFVVEKGLFFPKDYHIRYDQVSDVRDGAVYLSTKDLALGGEATAGGTEIEQETERIHAGVRGGAEAGSIAQSRDEVRVPLASEELEAEKHERQAGEVRVHKEVVTEQKQISVPVTREEVHVERVPAQGDEQPGQAAFQEGTVSVPVREEEVEIRKRPVVKEEVRVSRTRRQEERRADAEVRHEEARVEQAGDVDSSGEKLRSDIDEPER